MEQFEGMGDSEIKLAGKAIQEVKELFVEGYQEAQALEEIQRLFTILAFKMIY